jgi:hypothetical protein
MLGQAVEILLALRQLGETVSGIFAYWECKYLFVL